MKVPLHELARRLGLSPVQALFDLAVMGQPALECWPDCDDGFAQTLRLRQGADFSVAEAPASSVPERTAPALTVSKEAAAIVNKLIVKNYGPRPIRASTLVRKWVHGAADEHVEELVKRGLLEWADEKRQTVRLVLDRLDELRQIATAFRTAE